MARVATEEDVYVTETTYNRKTGLPVFRRTLLHGMLESPPDDMPSLIHYDEFGRPDRMEWHRYGQHHRESDPCVIYINPDNGIHVLERFEHHGVLRDKALGPNYIYRDHDTGEILSQTDPSELDLYNPATKLKPPSP